MQVSKAFVAVAVAALVGLDVGAAAAQSGPSFNCKRARTFVEKEICRSPSLSRKDREMAALYRSFLDQYVEGGGPGTDTSRIRSEQRAWLARRDRCQTTACLHRMYDARIRELEIDY